MDTSKLKKFAQAARRSLMDQVATKLDQVLMEGSAASRETPRSLEKLKDKINETSREQVIEKVAYIWFNRFTALRFMDVNGYVATRVVTPADEQTQPEILSEAKAGHVDEDLLSGSKAEKVHALLEGRETSPNPEGEAYRLLVVAACNSWAEAMPFLFQRIEDYTELLMPGDLLSSSSILADLRAAMGEEDCADVEVIGWLYQFYISEKKDEVFAGLKKNKKVTPDNIPAATQLFTPHWIVRYLVENSLGRLWLLNKPESTLAEKMDYYIKPDEPETDFLKVSSPEELKICDPACGSGHMLTYAFDLLYAIYEEEGYEPSEIPSLILTYNLYGVEIDERAGELAAFALTMKARAKHRRYFRKKVQPNICILENVSFADGELDSYMQAVGTDLFTSPLRLTLKQFEEADNFGSLIRPVLTDVTGTLQLLEERGVGNDLLLSDKHERVLTALKQADYLAPKYHVVIANPPYMGGKGMNGRLGAWAKDNYPESKADLFAMFIERNLGLVRKHGTVSMITMQSWMFLSSYEKLRMGLLRHSSILSMAHLGERAFDTIGGAVVSTTAFIIQSAKHDEFKGDYLRLIDGNSEAAKNRAAKGAINNPDCGWFFRASAQDFRKIPGSPIAYWVSEAQREAFTSKRLIGQWAPVKVGLQTGSNEQFVRAWHEVNFKTFGRKYSSCNETLTCLHKWFPYNKGGDFRKWYGNLEFVVNWENDGSAVKSISDDRGKIRSRPQNTEYYFKESVTWTFVSSGSFGVRFSPRGSIFDVAGSSAFPTNEYSSKLTAFMCSKVTESFLALVNPTLNYQVGNIASMPVDKEILEVLSSDIPDTIIKSSQSDWDAYETSWDFTSLPLLADEYRQHDLEATYGVLRTHWQGMTDDMQRLEEENNRIFIDAYGLQDELTPDVPLKEITLTCNPHYRYGGKNSADDLEDKLRTDTVKEFLSYSVGCMFGRYALDKPGLILANQGETLEDYLKQVPEPSFMPDKDNVIPILEDDWFPDDITERFRWFLRITFGEEQFTNNLRFIEESLGKDLRKYFIKDFYADHVKRYKKRPIYWLFSSAKGSFNALIYMHRYTKDTPSVVLNEYLREFRSKLQGRLEHLNALQTSQEASQSDKTKAIKEQDAVKKVLRELDEYEHDVLFPLASEQVEIDLDNGVKANYPELGNALKNITGLS